MATLNFAELAQAEHHIEFTDGSKVGLVGPMDFDTEGYAQLQELQVETQKLQLQISKSETKRNSLQIVAKFNDVLGDVIKLIAPGISDEQLASLKLGHRQAVLSFWKEQLRPEGNEGARQVNGNSN